MTDILQYNNISDTTELEQAILGAVLVDKRCIDTVLSRLRQEDFSSKPHQTLFNCFVRLYTANIPIDLISTIRDIDKNKESQIVTMDILFDLSNKVASTANTESHCYDLLNESIKRQLTLASLQWAKSSTDPSIDAIDQLSFIQSQLDDIQSRLSKKRLQNMPEMVKDAILTFEQNKKTKDILGFSTGINRIDYNTNGLGRGQLIVIAAGPGEGKSTFALQIANKVATEHGHVIYISLEMSKQELIAKLISNETNTSASQVMQGNIPNDFILTTPLTQSNLVIIDDTSNRFDDIYASIRMQATIRDVKMIVIDYLQLMSGDTRQTKTNEIGAMTAKLKGLARELQIPIIILSQVNRDKSRTDYYLSDLRDSGNIEQDADVVMFIFRPKCHGINYYKYLELENCDNETAAIKIEKCRLGKTGAVEVRFKGEFSRFENVGDTINSFTGDNAPF